MSPRLVCGVSARRSAGFTLTELLVVIAIIGILVALLLPAVQSTRETSNRLSCQNRLRQVGIALHSHHQAVGTFPPSAQSTPQAHGWVAFLLPYLDQKTLFDRYDWKVAWNHANNQEVINIQIPTLHCPSTPGGMRRIDKIGGNRTAATSDYTPIDGVNAVLKKAGLVPNLNNTAGALSRDRGVRMVEIRDGLACTLVIGEDGGRPDFYTGTGERPQENDPKCGNSAVRKGRVEGGGWADSGSPSPLHGFTADGLTCPGPCAINCTNNNETFAFHPGGVNTVFADGNVRFLNQSLDIKIYAALITRNNREIVPPSSF
jgi:prepilin-type N-terminal cleavage/methylation domain-containing protein/prepilin-type processing-associated H-X9-DG protein